MDEPTEFTLEHVYWATKNRKPLTWLLSHSPDGVAVLICVDHCGTTLAYAFSRVSPDAYDPREASFTAQQRAIERYG